MRGGCTRWTTHLGTPAPPGAPWWVVVPTWPPSLTSSSHITPFSQKKITITLSLSLSLSLVFLLPKPRILISLLEAPSLKLFQGFVAWYVTPPCVQLVFVLVVYILNN